ncbi:hypothetical protein [Lacrimispora saccharolytica]|nr:hypothetical protein [Lacrimispora saccharolytica]QRV20201.1 hypothetical protein I6K70_01165 [Lacrimispora saccharolytica]
MSAVVKGISDRNDHTISRVVSFLNCLFTLLLATSIFFPLKDIFVKYLVLADVKLISDVALVVWYCAIFLFWISTSTSFISFIAYSVLKKLESKIFYNKPFRATDRMHTVFGATHTAYLSSFDYVALSSFALLFSAPEKLLSVCEESFQWGNIFKNISMIFMGLSGIECVVSMIILISIKWVMPNYYTYKRIEDDIYKD